MNFRKLSNSEKKRELFLSRCTYIGKDAARPWNSYDERHCVEYRVNQFIRRYWIYMDGFMQYQDISKRKNGREKVSISKEVAREDEKLLVKLAAFPHYMGE